MSMRAAASMGLEVVFAMRTLGMLSSRDLPAIAITALTQGHDSPSLRRLAASDVSEDTRMLFEAAMTELGCTPMSAREAALTYARWICERIVLDQLTPYEGAKVIWNASLQAGDDPPPELDPFIYAASEFEDRPEDRVFFDAEIRKHAVGLIA